MDRISQAIKGMDDVECVEGGIVEDNVAGFETDSGICLPRVYREFVLRYGTLAGSFGLLLGLCDDEEIPDLRDAAAVAAGSPQPEGCLLLPIEFVELN